MARRLLLALLGAVACAQERSPGPLELPAYPEDGRPAAVNPPGFHWTPHPKATAYRLEVRNAAGRAVLTTGPLTSTVYPPIRKLAPGAWRWQVVYLAGGAAIGRSKTRRFTISANTPVLLLPDVAAIEKRLAGVRPRLFLSGDSVEALRRAVALGAVPSWPRMREAADAALLEKSYPEPAPYPPRRTPADWLRVFTPGKLASAHAARTALAWRLTGDVRYLAGARRWMMNLASWDPRGITSHRLELPDGSIGNDEASMPILERMSFAWDWAGNELTPAERARVIEVMTERGNQVYRKLLADDFLSHPFENHSGRTLAFLGHAGLSFLGDIPDARLWLDYVLRCLLTSYPPWGGDAGGWAQGLRYWSFYVYGLTNFCDAFRQAAGTDILSRPFYRRTGSLPLYFHPPYAPAGGFGDGSYHPPSELEGLLTGFLAETFRDPVLKWHAAQVAVSGEKNATRWREWFMEDVFATLRGAAPSTLEPAPPSHLDGARLFPDIGWAAMHSALGDAANDVWVLFKSSRFGSFNHSHADQNTFQLYAYGRALAIDSGYYPGYGTPHDNLWTRQTAAHNGILVNGRGQPVHTWAAGGSIDRFERHGPVTLVRGRAARAYNLPQPSGVAALWQKLLKIPLPPPEPAVETFDRTLAFAASKTRPVLVVHDTLRTAAPTTFGWLLHALNSMETGAAPGAILIREGDARLAVRLYATVPFETGQTGEFPIVPEEATNTAYVLGRAQFPGQWHLRAATTRPAREVRFLAVLVPYRASEVPPEIASDDTGIRVADVAIDPSWARGPLTLRYAEGKTLCLAP